VIVSHVHVAVLGALIGKQKGRNLEIMNSFELMFHVSNSSVIVDREYYTTKEDQCECKQPHFVMTSECVNFIGILVLLCNLGYILTEPTVCQEFFFACVKSKNQAVVSETFR